MKKKILVIGRREDRSAYDTAQGLVARMQPLAESIQYDSCYFEEVGIVYDGTDLKFTNTATQEDFADYDGIFMLGWFKHRDHEEIAQAVALYAQAKGIRFLNSEALHNRSHGKASQYVQAALRGTAAMPFALVLDGTRLSQLMASMPFPVVAKAIRGNRGNDNYLVHTAGELQKALAGSPETAFVAQPFIPNDGDYRLLIAGGQVRMAIHRQAATGSHLSNTSKGGQATIVELSVLPKAMLDDAIAIAKALNRELTGVDMVLHKDNGKHYFLEANNMPQLATGSFVNEKAQMLNDFFSTWVDA
jgi:glutathione synthase/RimK-type ligase-like ATP-grasp enzyme